MLKTISIVGACLFSAVNAADGQARAASFEARDLVQSAIDSSELLKIKPLGSVGLTKTKAGFCLSPKEGGTWAVTYTNDPRCMSDSIGFKLVVEFYPNVAFPKKATYILKSDGTASFSHEKSSPDELEKLGFISKFWNWFSLPQVVDAMKNLDPKWDPEGTAYKE